MSGAAKITWALVIIVFAAGAVGSQFIPALDTGVRLDSYTTNAGELTVDTLVGQTFTAEQDNLAAVSVMFATYSGRNNTEPVLFYLRSSIHSKENIRTVQVAPSLLKDNQLYRFEFEPILDSKGKQFFFFVVSPQSTAGNAVTVDLDTRDPYHLGSAFVVRGQGPTVTEGSTLERSGKPTQDVAFALHYVVPLRIVVTENIVQAVRSFVGGWRSDPDKYIAYGWAAAAAGISFLVLMLIQQRAYMAMLKWFTKQRLTWLVILVLMVIGLVYRLEYAGSLPLTNDEGNYLYDARTLRQGELAGGDGYVKAPLVIAWISFWQILLGDTVFAGRFASIIAGLAMAIPLYFLSRDIWSSRAVTKMWLPEGRDIESFQDSRRWGRRIGLATVAIWAVFGAAIISNIYVHTQPLALLFAVSGLAVLMHALRGIVSRGGSTRTGDEAPSKAVWFILAGILLGLGVASRKSILALGLVPFIFILLEGKNWNLRVRHFVSVGFGFVLVIGLFLGGAYMGYGAEGVREAIGVNSAEDGIGVSAEEDAEQVRAYSIRGMTPFFRESLPIILLSLLGLGFSMEFALATAFSRKGTLAFQRIVPRLGWVLPWLVFWWAWKFFFEYEGAQFMKYGIPILWWLFGGILILATLWPDPRRVAKAPAAEKEVMVPISTQPGFRGQRVQVTASQFHERMLMPRHGIAALTAPLWVGGLVFFYMNWIKFHANYISEFIPPLVILAAFGFVGLYRRLSKNQYWGNGPVTTLARHLLVVATILVVGYAITVSNFITYYFEHTGTFGQSSVIQAAAWAKEHIPRTDEIFTGAALIPYLSGHHVSLDIAHPRWYAYEFTRKDTTRLNTFLPPAEDMVQAYREAQWLIHEQQTQFSFMMEYPEIEASFPRDWEKVHEIENGGNPIVFYRRSVPAQ